MNTGFVQAVEPPALKLSAWYIPLPTLITSTLKRAPLPAMPPRNATRFGSVMMWISFYRDRRRLCGRRLFSSALQRPRGRVDNPAERAVSCQADEQRQQQAPRDQLPARHVRVPPDAVLDPDDLR